MRYLLRPMIKTLLRGPYADLALMEDPVATRSPDRRHLQPVG